MEFVVALLSSASVGAAVAVAIFWIFQSAISEKLKNSIKHEYDVKLESHKLQLQSANSIAQERLKADLQILASERQIRFTRLHEKVAETVAETYLLLVNFVFSTRLYATRYETTRIGSWEDRRKFMEEEMNKFDIFFKQHRLYLPKEIAASIDVLVDKMSDLAWDFRSRVEIGVNGLPDGNEWTRISNEIDSSSRVLLSDLEQEFRRLLGVPQ